MSYSTNGATVLLRAKLEVTDVNDNAPSFLDSDSVGEISLEGDAPLGSPVYRVPVSDPDAGDNGRLDYRISDPDGDLGIDRESGVIFLRTNVGRRSTRQREVEVTVSDGGQDRGRDRRLDRTRRYRVSHRLPGNRHTPTFDFDSQEVSVPESTPVNARILSLPAADPDEGPAGIVSYSLSSSSSSPDQSGLQAELVFGVLPGGDLRLLAPLDREARPEGYALTVTATDKGDPPR